MAIRLGVGRFKDRIIFQAQVATPDGAGGNVLTWADQGSAWAKVEPISAREIARHRGQVAEISHKITTPRRSDIAPTAAWRIKFGTRYFNVRSIIDVGERREFWEMAADEGVAT